MPPHRPLAGALGANFNEKMMWINHDELRRLGAQWVRGFIDMHETDSLHPEDDPRIKRFLRTADAGFKTVLSLKWAYTELDFPTAGSSEHAIELQRLERVLREVLDKVDILVIGNEPFLEAKPNQRGKRLNVFYEALADMAIKTRREQNCTRTRLYMGALNRLDLPARQTPAVDRMLHFIASRPEIDGVDLHPHMPMFAGHEAMLHYALARIRSDQTFLVTEFSMIWHWKKHLDDEASIHFCTEYGFPAGTKVYQIISSAIEMPWPYSQWVKFLTNEPWYMAQRHFITDSMRLYRATGRLAVATYSFCPMRHRKRPLLADDNPWLLNGMMAPPTVQLGADGLRLENFPWADEFRKVQSEGG